jgi:hypothetical protein
VVICQNQGFHLLIHQRTRAFIASGHATWRKCIFCKQYDSPKNMVLISTRALHRDCENRYRKLQYYRRKEDGK